MRGGIEVRVPGQHSPSAPSLLIRATIDAAQFVLEDAEDATNQRLLFLGRTRGQAERAVSYAARYLPCSINRNEVMTLASAALISSATQWSRISFCWISEFRR